MKTLIIDNVDRIEVAHVNNNIYYIFWDWDEDTFRVVDWRNFQRPVPIYDYRIDQYVLYYSESKCTRKIIAPAIMERWLTYDPEIEDRKIHPKRRKLTNYDKSIQDEIERRAIQGASDP